MNRLPPATTSYPWELLLLEGVISTAVGLAFFFIREPTLQAGLWLLGIYLMASAILAIASAFSPTGRGRRPSLALRAVVGLFAVAWLFGEEAIPGIDVSEIVLLAVAIGGVLIGLAGLMQAARGAGWGAAILGVLVIAAGYFVWRRSPTLLAHFITLLGVVFVIGGGATILLAVRMGIRSRTDNPIKVRHPLLGMLRVVALLFTTALGLAVAVPAWLLPIHYKAMKLNYWVLTYTCKVANRILRIDVQCSDRQVLLDHHGMVFPNHVSYLDIPVLVSLEPMRFLSTAEVFRVPFVGWMADSIMTVFVDRSSAESRASVREQIARRVNKDANPPFVIFPEGRFGTQASLRPYHRGAFEIASENAIPYLPCAIAYSRPDIAIWRGAEQENFILAVWRMLTFSGRLYATVIPLTPVEPSPQDDAVALAANAQRATESVLGFAPSPTTLEKRPNPTISNSVAAQQ